MMHIFPYKVKGLEHYIKVEIGKYVLHVQNE